MKWDRQHRTCPRRNSVRLKWRESPSFEGVHRRLSQHQRTTDERLGVDSSRRINHNFYLNVALYSSCFCDRWIDRLTVLQQMLSGF